MQVVERGTPEWDAIWSGLGRTILAAGLGSGLDFVQRNDEWSESWQYVGSLDPRVDGTQDHQFRHRAHPHTRGSDGRSQRVYVTITLGPGVFGYRVRATEEGGVRNPLRVVQPEGEATQ